MILRRILVFCLTAALLVAGGSGCGGDKGKGTNAGRDKPSRPEK